MTDQSDQRRAIAASLLKDAQLTGLSDATRVAAAFEAGLLYLEQAAMPPNLLKASFAQRKAILSIYFESLSCSAQDRRLGLRLVDWFECRYELVPLPCSARDAVAWATRIARLTER
ncbi:hypothetical protein RJD05_07380 [Ralstonia sp. 11b]|jgi:hypothetical protein|uniref:hypothetical protein n=1 Tax=Ralstonia sp. 11b TaxID=3063544 RepID=UPI00287069E0|nr:hypothetical protein [Ralstonia sp. 11b]MDR9384186.1 hypothetical protein [Ralstonia sp. 11b]